MPHPDSSPDSPHDACAIRDPRAFLRHLFDVAVKRALPLENTAAYLPAPPKAGRTVVIGAGKAGGSMAQAVEEIGRAHV